MQGNAKFYWAIHITVRTVRSFARYRRIRIPDKASADRNWHQQPCRQRMG